MFLNQLFLNVTLLKEDRKERKTNFKLIFSFSEYKKGFKTYKKMKSNNKDMKSMQHYYDLLYYHYSVYHFLFAL